MASTTKKSNEEWTRRNDIMENQRIKAEQVANSLEVSKDKRTYKAAAGLENLRSDNVVSMAQTVKDRGLLGGPGTPGNRATSVSPKAISPKNQTYWQQRNAGTESSANDMTLAGRMHRGALALEKEKEGSDGYKSAVKDVLDSFNGGSWSSREDAAGLIPSKDGKGFHLLDVKGSVINKNPVTSKDLQDVAGNVLTGQLVHQRNTNDETAFGLSNPSSNLNSAQINARSGIDKERLEFMAEEIKQLRTSAIPGDKTREDLISSKTKDYIAMSDSLRDDVSDGRGQPSLTPRQEVQVMVNEGRNNDYMRRVMWDKYGNNSIMKALEHDLSSRKSEGVNPRTGQQSYPQVNQPGGLQEPSVEEEVQPNERAVVPRGLPQPNAGRNKAGKKRTQERLENKPDENRQLQNKNRNVRSRSKTKTVSKLYKDTLKAALAGQMSQEDLNTFLIQNSENLDAVDLNKLIMMLR